MAGGEIKGLFGRLFGRARKDEEPAPETAKTKPGEPSEQEAERAAPREGEPPGVQADTPTSQDLMADIVELEMDIPEHDIPTMALSVKDLTEAASEGDEEQAQAQVSLSGLAARDTLLREGDFETVESTTEIKLEGADFEALELREPARPEIPGEAEEPETTTGGFPIAEVTLDVNQRYLAQEGEEEPAPELDLGDEEETPAVERAEAAPPEPVLEKEEEPELKDEEAAVTSGEVATVYGFPEYVEPATIEEATTGIEETASKRPMGGIPFATAVPAAGSLTGLADIPLTAPRLGAKELTIEAYSEALADFVQSCETPMNVSVGGEPGSGKTSLMRMVEARLDRSSCLPIRFNAWNYSRFSFSDRLPIVLIRHFVHEVYRLAEGPGDRAMTQMVEDASQRLKTAAWVDLLETDRISQAREIDRIAESLASGSVIESVDGLQRNLKALVGEALARSGMGRIVAFVDDLDKVEPVRAVNLLEAMRAFLAMENCVFVVACDLEAITESLEAKLGLDRSAGQGRSFCERLFQLSVNVPSWQTQMEQDLKGLLEIARFRSGHEDLNDYMRLLRFSIGFKPRRLKRIANKLVFIVRVRPEIGPEESQEPDSPARTQKLLFGLCCLESQYPAVFRTLLRTLGDDGGLERLMNEQLQDTEQIHLLDESDSILGQASEKSKAVHHLIAFMDAFRDILCEGDWVRKLDKDVLRELRELTVLMSTTEGSRPQELHGDERRSAMTQFVMSVKDRLVTRLGDAAPKGSDVFIRNWASSRPWFGLWYTEEESRKAWGPGRVHYELSFDTQNEDILTVSLKFNTHRALELGVRQEKLAELKDLRELKDKGFRYKDYENGWVEIAKVLYQCHCDSIHDLNDDEMESAAEELSALIKATHNVFVAGLPAPSAPTERPSTASERAMSCRVCNSTMEAMTLKDGSVGYRCDTCRKIYKPKPTS